MHMKFTHLADCHIGAWREPKLKDMAMDAFSKAIAISMAEKVDFILIAGDLFNNALPGIENLKGVVKELKSLKEQHIPAYIIPGSHDFSPSGKTMIDVLEEAGLAVNVVKGRVVDGKLQLAFTIDKKTGVKITGLLGKRGTLEKKYYDVLDIEHLEKESGHKIFMFHSAIAQLKPDYKGSMESCDISYLPKGFDYYAGGHVHIVKEYETKEYPHVVYPGPLFPANFAELEELDCGGFYIYDRGTVIRHDIPLKNVYSLRIDANHKAADEVEKEIRDKTEKKEFLNTIILIRVSGVLKTGSVHDIRFKELFAQLYSQGAYLVLKNTARLESEEFEEIQLDTQNTAEIEDRLIKEHLGQVKVDGWTVDKEQSIVKELIAAFESEKHEGEKVYEYEDRIKKMGDRIIDR